MRETKLWAWHMIAGVIILLFLGLHMIIMHLGQLFHLFSPDQGATAIEWSNVAARGESIFFMVTYIILLGAALYHGLYGLQAILFELNPTKGLKALISTILIVLGLALFILGSYVAIVARHVAVAS